MCPAKDDYPQDKLKTSPVQADAVQAFERAFPKEWGPAERTAAHAAFAASNTPEQQKMRHDLVARIRAELVEMGVSFPQDMDLFPDHTRLGQHAQYTHDYVHETRERKGQLVGGSIIDEIEFMRQTTQQPIFRWGKMLSKEEPPHNGEAKAQARLDYIQHANKYYERIPNKRILTAVHEVMHRIDFTENITGRIFTEHPQTFVPETNTKDGGAAQSAALHDYVDSEPGTEMWKEIQENLADVGMVYFVIANYGDNMRRDLQDIRDWRLMVPGSDHNTGSMMQRAMQDYDKNPAPGMSLREAMRRAEKLVGNNLDALKQYHDEQAVAAKVMADPVSSGVSLQGPEITISLLDAFVARNRLLPGDRTEASCIIEKMETAQDLVLNKDAPDYDRKYRDYTALRRCAMPELATPPVQLHDQSMAPLKHKKPTEMKSDEKKPTSMLKYITDFVSSHS